MDLSQRIFDWLRSWRDKLQVQADAVNDSLTSLAANVAALNAALQAQNMVAAGLGIKSGGADPTFKTTNTIKYFIGGAWYTKAAAATTALSSTTHILTAFKALFLVQIDSAGTITTKQGAALATASVGPVLPTPDAGKCPIGSILVDNNSGSDFIPGTTNLDASSVTVTYTDFVGPVYPPLLTVSPAQPADLGKFENFT